MAAQSSPKKKELFESGTGFHSKSKRSPKPFAVRDFPRNCGPSKPNTTTLSPVIESSPSSYLEESGPWTDGGRTEGFKNMEKPKISDDIAEETGGENGQKTLSESALEEVEEIIGLAREFIAVLDCECSASKNSRNIVVSAGQTQLMEAVKSEGEGVGVKVMCKPVDGQNLEEKFGEGGANMDLRWVQENNAIGSEMQWDYLGDGSMETGGEGVVGEILSKSVRGQNLDEKIPVKDEECGADMNLASFRENDNTGLELQREELGDNKFGPPYFEKRFHAKALMAENHAKFDGDGGGVAGSKRTDIVVLEEDDLDREVSISKKNGKNCREDRQEPEVLDLNPYEVEKEQDESWHNFKTGDNLACVEFQDTCNDQPKTHGRWEELVNSCIGKHDQPEGQKVREALLKFEDHFNALQKERKERKSEMGEEQKRMKVHIEAAKRVKAEGMYISVRKPFGHIPGIEIGYAFQFRSQLEVVGLHHQMMDGIDYVTIDDEKFATSVVDSGRYENESKTNDSLTYSGQGGCPNLVDKAADQKLIKGNLAMVNSRKMGVPVRVVRKRTREMASHVFGPSNDKKSCYVYDGLYKVTKYWKERDQNGRLVFKFELIRMPSQPRPRPTVAKSGKLFTHKEVCIINDISGGLENRPIRAMNGIDDSRPPPFTYINKITYLDCSSCMEPVGCDCLNGCSDSHQCPCVVRNGGEIPFNEKGSLLRPRPIVYECGPACKCPPSCMNRVSQHGPRIQLEIFKTRERGWGLRTRNYVTSGSFICEYMGEFLPVKEAGQRIGEDEYLFYIGDGLNKDGEHLGLVDSRNHDVFAIDAGKSGNVGRFVNHSCSPNMYAQEVLYDHDDEKMPHIMFFATRNIPPSQELTYNYNYKIDRVRDVKGNIKKKHCFCGSPNCNGRMC